MHMCAVQANVQANELIESISAGHMTSLQMDSAGAMYVVY